MKKSNQYRSIVKLSEAAHVEPSVQWLVEGKKKKEDLDIVVKILLCFRILAHLKFSNFSPKQFREIWGQLYVNNIDKMEFLYF